jgi:protein-S-isoprenylcysteine O-methyltransferase Ste14
MVNRRQLAGESWARFVGYVPEMGRRWFALAWLATVVGVGGSIWLATAWLSWNRPWLALGVQCGLISALWGTAHQGFWRGRAAARARHGAWAYRALFFRYVGPTVALLFAAAWLPLAATGGPRASWALSRGVAAYLLLTGGLISARGRDLFWNIDLRAFVYSVFPEEGRWVRSPLFERLRHPIYSAAVRWILGLAVLRGNLEALACGLLLAAGFALWAGLEDREMTSRFVDYHAYRLETPGLFVLRPTRLPGFWRYLLRGGDSGSAPNAPAAVKEGAVVVAGDPRSR